MNEIVTRWFEELKRIQEDFLARNSALVVEAARVVAAAFGRDRKLMIAGNGGSAADAQHMAAEFVNRFRMERPPLPAIALTTDSSVLTSIGNDYSYDDVFVKQVKALGVAGDVLLAISTSGRSPNVLAAAREARQRGIFVIGLSGKDGGPLAQESDLAIVVPAEETAHVQEVHLVVEHLVCEMVDRLLFMEPGA